LFEALSVQASASDKFPGQPLHVVHGGWDIPFAPILDTRSSFSAYGIA
jgi:hypothetical protein